MNASIPQDAPQHKYCSNCSKWLLLSCFSRDKSRKDGLCHFCRDCRLETRKKNLHGNIDYRRDCDLRRSYQITKEQYDNMLESQSGVCASCKQPETAFGSTRKIKPLAVDHDHQTGLIRGLLCHVCNTTLGMQKDDPQRLRALADYIEQYLTPLSNPD